MSPPLHVETDLDLHVGAVDGLAYRVPRRVPAVLRWTADDPWAVQLDFAHGLIWTVGWDLLEQAARRGWYHTLELPGLTTPGLFDLRPYVGHYGLPASLEGTSMRKTTIPAARKIMPMSGR